MKKVGDTKYQVVVSELPSFYKGLCYKIESNFHFHVASTEFWITFQRHENVDLESVSVWLTSQYDYLSLANYHLSGGYVAFKISFPFGKKEVSRIQFKQNQFQSLECEKSNPEYISKQQCLASYFNSNDYYPCPMKCIPIRMKGFKYVNDSAQLPICHKNTDEICNGG